MRRWLFNFAAAVSLVLLLGTVGLWTYSEWHFTRISFTYGLPSELQDRRITFLAWSNAVELMIQKEGLQPDQGCTQEQLRQEVKHMAYTKVYQQEELSTDEPDIQILGFSLSLTRGRARDQLELFDSWGDWRRILFVVNSARARVLHILVASEWITRDIAGDSRAEMAPKAKPAAPGPLHALRL